MTLPPIKIGDHPCAPAMIWGELEIAWITEYAQAAVLVERERWRSALVARAEAISAANTSRRWINSAAAWVRDTVQELADELGSPARAALSAPAGWQLVPVEPTQEIVRAGWIDKEDTNPDDIWAAMLAAAPSPQEPKT